MSIKRRRHYGIIKGDTVKDERQFKGNGEVVETSLLDNNCVYVKVNDKNKPIKCVAEWLTIIEKAP